MIKLNDEKYVLISLQVQHLPMLYCRNYGFFFKFKILHRYIHGIA